MTVDGVSAEEVEMVRRVERSAPKLLEMCWRGFAEAVRCADGTTGTPSHNYFNRLANEFREVIRGPHAQPL